jgi:hypothetical protein
MKTKEKVAIVTGAGTQDTNHSGPRAIALLATKMPFVGRG